MKKIIQTVLIIAIIMISNFSLLSNTVKAVDSVEVYAKETFDKIIKFNGRLVNTIYIVHQENGVEYPAYCLNRNLPGVTEDEEYTVSADKLVTDAKIWRAVTNGYPFKTAKELGCNSDIEAFAATKMAVYDAMYNYDWSDFEGLNAQGNRVVAAAEKIAKAARSSSSTKPVSIVTVKTDAVRWELDTINKEYASKTFTVTTNVESTKYDVKLNNVQIENVKVTDEKNNAKTTFKAGEKFKVLIPISEMDKAGRFQIEVTADMKTRPILYGDSGNSTLQSYALAAGDYEYESSKIEVNYLKNTTSLELVKRDVETMETLKGAKFNVLDENKNIVYSDLETNEDGTVKIEGMKPGKYYIQEIKSPDGYTTYGDLIDVNLKLNQAYRVYVNNYEKPEDEEKQVEDEDKTVVGEKEINLPRTGF